MFVTRPCCRIYKISLTGTLQQSVLVMIGIYFSISFSFPAHTFLLPKILAIFEPLFIMTFFYVFCRILFDIFRQIQTRFAITCKKRARKLSVCSFVFFKAVYYIALLLISSSSFAVKSATLISPSSPSLLERTVSVPASVSRSPITQI